MANNLFSDLLLELSHKYGNDLVRRLFVYFQSWWSDLCLKPIEWRIELVYLQDGTSISQIDWLICCHPICFIRWFSVKNFRTLSVKFNIEIISPFSNLVNHEPCQVKRIGKYPLSRCPICWGERLNPRTSDCMGHVAKSKKFFNCVHLVGQTPMEAVIDICRGLRCQQIFVTRNRKTGVLFTNKFSISSDIWKPLSFVRTCSIGARHESLAKLRALINSKSLFLSKQQVMSIQRQTLIPFIQRSPILLNGSFTATLDRIPELLADVPGNRIRSDMLVFFVHFTVCSFRAQRTGIQVEANRV